MLPFLDVTPAGCKFSLITGLYDALPNLIWEPGQVHSSPILSCWVGGILWQHGLESKVLNLAQTQLLYLLCDLGQVRCCPESQRRATSTSQVGWHVKIASCQIQKKKCISFSFSFIIDKISQVGLLCVNSQQVCSMNTFKAFEISVI